MSGRDFGRDVAVRHGKAGADRDRDAHDPVVEGPCRGDRRRARVLHHLRQADLFPIRHARASARVATPAALAETRRAREAAFSGARALLEAAAPSDGASARRLGPDRPGAGELAARVGAAARALGGGTAA